MFKLIKKLIKIKIFAIALLAFLWFMKKMHQKHHSENE